MNTNGSNAALPEGLTFQLAHVGINAGNEEAARQVVDLLCALLGLAPREGKKSIFAGTEFEVMKIPFYGTKGHIGMVTSSSRLAREYLAGMGYASIPETETYDSQGNLTNFYIQKEIGGFAFHFVQKK